MTCDHKFIDTNYCAKCGASVDTIRTRSSYPDDVVAVMRDTISEQRALIDELRRELLLAKPLRLRFDAENAVLAAVAELKDQQLIWYTNSTPFRHICRAEFARRHPEVET